jgi:hypothetical protein
VVHQLNVTRKKQKIQAILLVNVLVLELIIVKIKLKRVVMLLQKKLINKKQCINMVEVQMNSDF